MPILPSFFERLLLFRIHRAPGFLSDFLGAQAFKALAAGANLGIFELLVGKPRLAGEIARALRSDERGTTILLEALRELGYLRLRKGFYSNSRLTSTWLLKSSHGSFAPALPFFSKMVHSYWDNLEDSVHNGGPSRTLYEWLNEQPGGWEQFLESQRAPAMISLKEVVRTIRLPSTARTLLDIGGGHALYSIALCKENPQLSAVLLDSHHSRAFARKTIESAQMQHRVEFREGDFGSDPIEGTFDVVLLFNILHGGNESAAYALCRKALQSMSGGGQIIILEQMADYAPGRLSRAFTRLHALNLFTGLGGQVFSSKEIANMLKTAGFRQIRAKRLISAPLFGIMTATKALLQRGILTKAQLASATKAEPELLAAVTDEMRKEGLIELFRSRFRIPSQ